MIRTILLIFLVLALLAALPLWPTTSLGVTTQAVA